MRRESLSGDLHGEAEESQPTESRDDEEIPEDSWSIQGNFIYRHHIEPRIQLYVPERRITPYSTENTLMSSGQLIRFGRSTRKMNWWLLECRRKQKSVRFVDGFQKIYVIERNSSEKGYMWSRRRLTKIQTTSRPDHTWPDAWIRIGKAGQRREKQEWAIEKPKLEYARNLRGIHSIDPSDEEYKDIIENARRKLETPKAAAMPCNRAFSQACIRATVVSKTKKNQGISCITEAHKSTRQRTESVTKRIHEEHIATIWCINLFRCRKQWRFQMQRQHWTRNGKSLRKFQHRTVTSKKEVLQEAQKNNNKVHVASRITKEELCFEETLWKTTLDPMQYSLNKDHQHHKWQPQKSWTLYQDYQDAQDKQLTQYLLIHRSK